eukprot:TRINITY_DN30905_c0_g1_i1.p1 TRINITY_DN30905_c0_g1~~TRINITY_DN30905_c0_g1_i1.p1  ORF type:complete len:455 (-),score=128.20 TRINITY_DN30905_c0_g1_i1:100-1464(-)
MWKSLLQDFASHLPLPQAAQGGAREGAGRSRGGYAASGSAAPGSAGETSFREAWQTYCNKNPRLRDPRTLPALVRRRAPEDRELRAEVWLHCLGATSTSSSSSSASPKSSAVAKAADVAAIASSPAAAESKEAAAVAEPKEVAAAADGAGAPVASNAASETEDDAAKEDDAAADAPAAACSEVEMPELPCTADEELPDAKLGDLIEADVLRTFPSNATFRRIDGQERLRRVLRRLAATDSDLGYCQSLNLIAAVFLLVLRDEIATLACTRQMVLKLNSRAWYLDGMRQLRADTIVLGEMIQERLPQLHETFRKHQFDLLFVSSKWFLCLFTTALEGEALYRVWDCLIVDGIEAVFRVALALFQQFAEAAVAVTSPDDLIFLFQDKTRETRPDVVVSAAYDPTLAGSIGKAELAQRRQQALRKIAEDDTRAEMRNRQYMRGGVRPASVLARVAVA